MSLVRDNRFEAELNKQDIFFLFPVHSSVVNSRNEDIEQGNDVEQSHPAGWANHWATSMSRARG